MLWESWHKDEFVEEGRISEASSYPKPDLLCFVERCELFHKLQRSDKIERESARYCFKCMIYWVGWSSGIALVLYSRGVQFGSRLGLRLSWQIFLGFPQLLQANIVIVPRLIATTASYQVLSSSAISRTRRCIVWIPQAPKNKSYKKCVMISNES
jgi:hypothetical protein